MFGFREMLIFHLVHKEAKETTFLSDKFEYYDKWEEWNNKSQERQDLLKDANNHEITNDNETAELINSYFINVGSELAAKFPEAEDLCQLVYRVTPILHRA